MDFDGSWKLTLPDSKIPEVNATDWPPPFLSNGKLVILPRMDQTEIAVQQTLLTVEDYRSSGGTVYGNALQTFNFGSLRLFHREKEPDDAGPRTTYQLTGASLHMDTGTYSSTYDVNVDAAQVGTVTQEIYAARQYPYVAVQTFTVRVKEGELVNLQGSGDACFFHEFQAPPGAGHTAKYDTSFILTQDKTSVFMFTGRSALLPPPPPSSSRNSSAHAHAHVASCYLWDPAHGSFYEVAGFNVDRNRPGVAFNRINIYDGTPVIVGSENMREFKFHILTSTMTDGDFPLPEEETRRVLLAVINRGSSSFTSGGNVHVHLRTEHTRKWDAMWATNVNVVPKLGITVAEMQRLTQLKRHIRYALYNMYSSIRGGTDVFFNPNDLGLVDLSGRIASHGDVWFMPCLLMLKPAAARAVTDARYEGLPHAKRLASTYGFQGAKFPFSESAASGSRIGSAVFWDAVAVTRVFNTALVGINAWNYYRLTRDKDWLRSKGFPVLQGVADFAASAFELDATNGKYRLVKSIALDGSQGAHNAFTVNACLLALKAAIEASYALGFGTQRRWTTVYFNAQTIYIQSAAPLLKGVVKFDADHVARDPVRIAEPLLVLTPTYSEVMYPEGKNNLQNGLIKNFDYFTLATQEAGTQGLPINAALFALVEGLRSQTDTNRVGQFFDALETFIDTSKESVWGNLRSYDGRQLLGSTSSDNNGAQGLNDVSTSAMLILTVLNVAAGADVVGGVSDTQFMYNELRLSTARFRKMPRTWLGLRVTGLGGGNDNILVTNELLYPG
jgi:hypothetical protein